MCASFLEYCHYIYFVMCVPRLPLVETVECDSAAEGRVVLTSQKAIVYRMIYFTVRRKVSGARFANAHAVTCHQLNSPFILRPAGYYADVRLGFYLFDTLVIHLSGLFFCLPYTIFYLYLNYCDLFAPVSSD